MSDLLKPEGYADRIVDRQLERLLQLFGAVEVAGTMWCGKTWTSLAHAASVTRIGLAGPRSAAEADPSTALLGAKPHLIDEWQDVPAIWNAARHRIDDLGNARSQFIFTGSSTPNYEAARSLHSGAGRIARLHMRTMTLRERNLTHGGISLAGLFDPAYRKAFSPKLSSLGLGDIAGAVCRGGWPVLAANPDLPSQDIVDEYLAALFEDTMPRAGKSPQLAESIARSLARNVATSATVHTLALDAAQGDSSLASDATVKSYIDEFRRNYFIEELSGWDAPVRAKSRLRTKPKRYFSDPSLVTSLLGVNRRHLLEDSQLLGLLFESQCIHDLLVYASMLPDASREPLHYYRDSDNLEVDVIVELRDGRWAGIEVKLGEGKVPEATDSLNRLRKKVSRNPAARNPEPEFMAVLLAKGVAARYLPDEDVYVIPIDLLEP